MYFTLQTCLVTITQIKMESIIEKDFNKALESIFNNAKNWDRSTKYTMIIG